MEQNTYRKTTRAKQVAQSNKTYQTQFFGHLLTKDQVEIQQKNIELIEKQAKTIKIQRNLQFNRQENTLSAGSRWQNDNFYTGLQLADSLMESTTGMANNQANLVVTDSFGEGSDQISREFDLNVIKPKNTREQIIIPKIKLNIIEENSEAKRIAQQNQSFIALDNQSSLTQTNNEVSIIVNKQAETIHESPTKRNEESLNRLKECLNPQKEYPIQDQKFNNNKTFDSSQEVQMTIDKQYIETSTKHENSINQYSVMNGTLMDPSVQQDDSIDGTSPRKRVQKVNSKGINIDSIIQDQVNSGEDNQNQCESPQIKYKQEKSRMTILSLKISQRNKQKNEDLIESKNIQKSPLLCPNVNSVQSSRGDRLGKETAMSLNSPLKFAMNPHYDASTNAEKQRLATSQPYTTRKQRYMQFQKQNQISHRQSSKFFSCSPNEPQQISHKKTYFSRRNKNLKNIEKGSVSVDSQKYNVAQIVNIDFLQHDEASILAKIQSPNNQILTTQRLNLRTTGRKVSLANNRKMQQKSKARTNINGVKSPVSNRSINRTKGSPQGSIEESQDQIVINMVQRCNLNRKNQGRRQIFSQEQKQRKRLDNLMHQLPEENRLFSPNKYRDDKLNTEFGSFSKEVINIPSLKVNNNDPLIGSINQSFRTKNDFQFNKEVSNSNRISELYKEKHSNFIDKIQGPSVIQVHRDSILTQRAISEGKTDFIRNHLKFKFEKMPNKHLKDNSSTQRQQKDQKVRFNNSGFFKLRLLDKKFDSKEESNQDLISSPLSSREQDTINQINYSKLDLEELIKFLRLEKPLIEGNEECMKMIQQNNHNITMILEEFQKEIFNSVTVDQSVYKIQNRKKLPLMQINKLKLKQHIQNQSFNVDLVDRDKNKNDSNIARLSKLETLRKQIIQQQKYLVELQQLDHLMKLIKSHRLQETYCDSSLVNNKQTGIDFETLEKILQEKLNQFQSNIVEEFEQIKFGASSYPQTSGDISPTPQTTKICQDLENKSFKQSNLTLDKSEENIQPIQEIKLSKLKGKSNNEYSDQDTEILKQQLKVEYRKYDEFVKEAKKLGVDFVAMRPKHDFNFLRSSFETSTIKTGSGIASPATFSEMRMKQINASNLSPNETALSPLKNPINFNNSEVQNQILNNSKKLEVTSITSQEGTRMENKTIIKSETKLQHEHFQEAPIDDRKDDTVYIQQPTSAFSYPKQSSHSIQNSLIEVISDCSKSKEQDIKNDNSNAQTIRNLAMEHMLIDGHRSPETPIDESALSGERNPSNISVMNIKKQSEAEKRIIRQETLNSDLKLTTESDQKGNEEMLQFIDQVNDTEKVTISEKQNSTRAAHQPYIAKLGKQVGNQETQRNEATKQLNKIMSPRSMVKLNYLKKFPHGMPQKIINHKVQAMNFSSISPQKINLPVGVSNVNQLAPLQLGIMGSKISSKYSKPASIIPKTTKASSKKQIQFLTSRHPGQIFHIESDNKMQRISLGIGKAQNIFELKGQGIKQNLRPQIGCKYDAFETRNLASMSQVQTSNISPTNSPRLESSPELAKEKTSSPQRPVIQVNQVDISKRQDLRESRNTGFGHNAIYDQATEKNASVDQSAYEYSPQFNKKAKLDFLEQNLLSERNINSPNILHSEQL